MTYPVKEGFLIMGKRFKAIRAHFGLSQAQFAQKTSKSPGFISNVETGRSNISEETISSVCSVFNINRGWLTTGTGEMFVDGVNAGIFFTQNAGRK